jgi:hypothetical protein
MNSRLCSNSGNVSTPFFPRLAAAGGTAELRLGPALRRVTKILTLSQSRRKSPCLSPAPHIELPQQVRHVVIHCFFRQVQLFGDLAVSHPVSNQIENSPLPGRQTGYKRIPPYSPRILRKSRSIVSGSSSDSSFPTRSMLRTHSSLSIHVGIDKPISQAIGALPRGRGLLGMISRTAKSVRVDHVAEHPDFTGFPPNHTDMGSFLGVPVRLESEIFGNLYLADKDGGFSENDQQAVEGLAIVSGAAISTARLQLRLRRLAVFDDRERIARNLHGAISQDLFAVRLTLQVRPKGRRRRDCDRNRRHCHKPR